MERRTSQPRTSTPRDTPTSIRRVHVKRVSPPGRGTPLPASVTSLSIPRLLTAGEVAEILGVSRAQAYLLKDRIGHVVVGSRSVRFEPDAVFAYVQGQRRCHEPALASSEIRGAPTGTPSGPTARVATTASPRAAEIMARRRRGSRRVN